MTNMWDEKELFVQFHIFTHVAEKLTEEGVEAWIVQAIQEQFPKSQAHVQSMDKSDADKDNLFMQMHDNTEGQYNEWMSSKKELVLV